MASHLQVTTLTEEGTLLHGGAELIAREGVRWIDLTGPDAAAMEPLAKQFQLHRLAVEDCLHLDQRPKLEEYPAHLFMVLHGFEVPAHDITEVDLHELHIFVGPTWLLTVHDKPSAAIEAAQKRIAADPAGTFGRGPDFIAYLVADALVDADFPILDGFSDEVEELEDSIFSGRVDPATVERIFALKRMLVTLRRVLSPQRDVVGMLSRRGLPHIQERTTLFFRDVYDHLVRLYEQIDASRDLLGNAMDAYLSMVANRTNDITKQLTIFASIFLPMSFVVGFFGQNFEILSRPPFLYVMIGTLAAMPLGMIFWFRHKQWI